MQTEKFYQTIDLLMMTPDGQVLSARTLFKQEYGAGHKTLCSKFSELTKQFTDLLGEPDLRRPVGSSWTETRWDPKLPHDSVTKLVISWEVPAYSVLKEPA
tara:strand:- start:106 stop:408 length:303 start_codon:yes stop_codon:yes gene_type:complete